MPVGEKLKEIKCPKCKKIVTSFLEYWADTSIHFDEDILLGKCKPCLNMEPTGHPYKVHGQCDCGHEWRIRKTFQISELIID